MVEIDVAMGVFLFVVMVGSGVSGAVVSGAVVSVGADVGGAGASTVNANSPEIGCPSLETTRQITEIAPDAVPVSAWVTVTPSTTAVPSMSDVPAASVTSTTFDAPSPSSSALNDRVISAGSAVSTASAAGSVETS